MAPMSANDPSSTPACPIARHRARAMMAAPFQVPGQKMRIGGMKRRTFIAALGGAAAWPAAASAQQRKAVRRIGVLTGGSGPDSQARLETFLLALSQLGWTEGQNVQFEIRRGGGDADAIRKHATELATLAPDVIMTIGGTATGRLLQATRTVPIVFTIVPDPVGSGFVASLSRPGGNATGFLAIRIQLERKMAGAAQRDRAGLRRVAVLRDSTVVRRGRPVCRCPVRRAVARDRSKPHRRAGRRRNRARCDGVCALQRMAG